jgi:hypothetical protein
LDRSPSRFTTWKRAKRFYNETLGLPLLFSVADQLVFLDCGGVRLMLARPEPGFDHPPSVLYFRVDDIEPRSARSRPAAFTSCASLIAWRTWVRTNCGWRFSGIRSAPRTL